MSAIFTAILGGLSSAFTSRRARRDARDQANLQGQWTIRDRNVRANQERETLLYQMQLQDIDRQNRRRERARGGRNFAQFAAPIPDYVNRAPMNTEAMLLPRPTLINHIG